MYIFFFGAFVGLWVIVDVLLLVSWVCIAAIDSGDGGNGFLLLFGGGIDVNFLQNFGPECLKAYVLELRNTMIAL